MARLFIPFSEYDPAHENGRPEAGGLLRLENVVPAWGGYRSLPKLEDGDDIAGRLTSAYFHEPLQQHYFGGQNSGGVSALWTINQSTALLQDLSGAAYASGFLWRFASFGLDVWAFDGVTHPQRRTAGAGNFANGVASTFIPLARCAAPVREFMVVGSTGSFEDEIAWSDIRDATWFDDRTGTRPASLAGRLRILSRPGRVTSVVGGQSAVIFKTHSMHALSFTGGSDVWRLDDISTSVGTEYPLSIIECSDGVRRFWGGDDFYEQEGLGAPVALGHEGIKSLLLDSGARSGMSFPGIPGASSDGDALIFGANEENLRCAFWFYQGASDVASTGVNRAVVYNYALRKWSVLVFSGVHINCACTSRSRIAFFNHPGEIVIGRTTSIGPIAAVYATFISSTNYAITATTQRMALGAGEGARPLGGKFKVKGVLPVIELDQSTSSPDYRMTAAPSAAAVRVITANDQLWKQQTDAAGTQVSPRSESRTMADVNDLGWLTYAAHVGASMMLELTIPESTTAIRGIPGCWVDYEVVP